MLLLKEFQKKAIRDLLDRKDRYNNELFICQERYLDDINNNCWAIVEEAINEKI